MRELAIRPLRARRWRLAKRSLANGDELPKPDEPNRSEDILVRFSLLPLSIAACAAPLSFAAEAASLRVVLTGVRSAAGELQIDLHDADKKRRIRRRIAATAGSVVVPIADLAPGAYAVQVYHDENGNGRLDTGGLLGLPIEGYGFSKDAPVRFGPPSFEAMRVDVASDKSVAAPIRLRYPRGAK